MRRCPSFSSRPGFPRGLQVLVLDPDLAAGVEAEVQLKDCGYHPITCCSSAEALLHLTNPDCSFDLLLVDVMCLSQKSPENSVLLAAAKTLPLVLMSSCCSPGDIMIGIKQGAVDFLEKPLHMHRLRNIWQHVVRRMMGGGAAAAAAMAQQAAACDAHAAAAAAAAAGGDGAGSVGNSAACVARAGPEDSAGAGETGSNESTSDRANGKLAQETMELDLETSSLLDAMDAALGNPLAGLTSGFSHMLMTDNLGPAASAATPSAAGPCAGAPAPVPGSGENSAAARQLPSGGRFSADLPRQAQRAERKPRTSTPGNTFSSSGGDSKPAVGYPAGQLPFVGPGVEWGLPTNPIQIVPKVSMPMMAPKQMMPSMPWMSPMMPPAAAMMMAMQMGGNPAAGMLPGMMPAAAAAAVPHHMKAADMQPALPPFIAPAPAPAVAAAPKMPAPAPAPAACAPPPAAAAPDLLSALSCSKAQKAPIGLSLKKSMSLVDLINDSLMKHGAQLTHIDCSQ